MSPKKSFLELAAEEAARSKRAYACILCTHPERKDIDRLLTDQSQDKTSIAVIARALMKSGIFGGLAEVTAYERVQKHKRGHIEGVT